MGCWMRAGTKGTIIMMCHWLLWRATMTMNSSWRFDHFRPSSPGDVAFLYLSPWICRNWASIGGSIHSSAGPAPPHTSSPASPSFPLNLRLPSPLAASANWLHDQRSVYLTTDCAVAGRGYDCALHTLLYALCSASLCSWWTLLSARIGSQSWCSAWQGTSSLHWTPLLCPGENWLRQRGATTCKAARHQEMSTWTGS